MRMRDSVAGHSHDGIVDAVDATRIRGA